MTKTEETKQQKWKQLSKSPCNTYEEARELADSLDCERIKIRRRSSNNTFDVITYTPCKPLPVEEPETEEE